MRQFRVKRLVGSVNWVSGGVAKIDLPRQYDLESLFITVSGTVTNADAGTAVPTESPVQLIQRVELVADGKNTIASVPFWALVWAAFQRPEMLLANANLRTAPGTTAAAHPVAATGVLDQATIDGVRPKDSNFRTTGLQLWELKFTFGTAIETGIGVDAATFVGTVDVWIAETVELPDAAGKFSEPAFLKKVSFQQYSTVASNSNLEVRLPAGNLIRSIMVRAGAVDPVNTIVNRLTVQSGVDTRFTMTAAQLRAMQAADYGLLAQAGYFNVDFLKQGPGPVKLANLWDVTKQAEPKLLLDVTGVASSTVQVVTTEYIALGK